MPNWSGRKILKYIRQGHQDTYEAVVRKNYKAIYRFLSYLTRDANLAEDLTQETFVSALGSIKQYKGVSSIETWLHRIAYHKFIDSKRQAERQSNLNKKIKEEAESKQQNSDPLYCLMTDEYFGCIYKAIDMLQRQEYLVIVMHYIQGLNYRQMSKILDEPVGTIKWRTSKALRKLKSFLSDKVEYGI